MELNAQVTLCRASDQIQCFVPAGESEQCDFIHETFGIDDARRLSNLAYQKPQTAATQQLVIRSRMVTSEAQNALLKLFEEPPETTYIVLVVPTDCYLLPTLLSRVHQVSLSDESVIPAETPAFSAFLQANYQDRLLAIESAHKKKDTAWQQAIKQGLAVYLQKQSLSVGVGKEQAFVLRHLLTRGASNKLLLEHLALLLPVK
jgi:hypothetical protein